MENNLIDKFVEIIGHKSVAEYFEGRYGLVIGKIRDKYIIQLQATEFLMSNMLGNNIAVK